MTDAANLRRLVLCKFVAARLVKRAYVRNRDVEGLKFVLKTRCGLN
jgi:hypothetical protein